MLSSLRQKMRAFFVGKYNVPVKLYDENEYTFYNLIMNKSLKYEQFKRSQETTPEQL